PTLRTDFDYRGIEIIPVPQRPIAQMSHDELPATGIEQRRNRRIAMGSSPPALPSVRIPPPFDPTSVIQEWNCCRGQQYVPALVCRQRLHMYRARRRRIGDAGLRHEAAQRVEESAAAFIDRDIQGRPMRQSFEVDVFVEQALERLV